MAPPDVLWTGYVFFVIADALVSVLRRLDIPDQQSSVVGISRCIENIADDRSSDSAQLIQDYFDRYQAIVRQIRADLDKPLFEFIEKTYQISREALGTCWFCEMPYRR